MILSIDQGTTGTTVLIVNRHGRVVGHAYAELPQHYPKPGWVEHRPQEILAVTWKVIRHALADARLAPSRVSAVGITNQRETTILWDRRSGKPLANAIVWQCRRTAPMCAELKRRGAEPEVRRKTGLVLDAYFSGTKVRWLLDHVAGARRRAQRGDVAFGTVDSWLIWHLTGGAVHATDMTNASRTLLYNIRTRRWDPALLDRFHVPSQVLPEVLPCTAPFGMTAKGGPLPAGIPIAGVAGDQQASMVGHGCLKPGMAKNTYGTGCFLLLHTGRRFVPSRHGLITTLIYGGGEQPAYALEGSVFIAGAAIQWLRDALGVVRTAAETEAIARRTKDTGGVYVVPAFVGLGAPYWDMDARGAIVGLTRGAGRDAIVRATLESLAYQTRDVVESMERDSGIRLRELRVDGGASRNDWLMQFQADLLGVPVARPAMVANTGKGAALLAGIQIGWWKPHALGALIGRPERRFLPRMSRAERDRRYAGWREAVARVRTETR
ncbi:MAG: glycerol kinase [Candidatus Omnitrophica bacterium CG11_big_fil_rev_8_21_14_0_20_63_9]|nr:MAG: glycerol kinase [Candidatus Omnitrophica bacterium CG11_big_fil_rev_8_21_14_0_20_63_9]